MTRELVRIATQQEIDNWDDLILTNPDRGELFQTHEMGEIKRLQGWIPEYWVYELSGGNLYAQALVRKIRGLGEVIYVIRGPGVVDFGGLNKCATLTKKWRKSAILVKFEPPILKATRQPQLAENLVPIRAVQPNSSTIRVDLGGSEDDILASFRQRARREIRAGIKDGVRIKRVDISPKNMNTMYALYRETSDRAGFFIKTQAYFEKFWTTYNRTGHGRLYFAYSSSEEEPIAGAFVILNGTKAIYKDGGSKRTGERHFAHLLQWEVMKDIKRLGVTEYDLHGVPPADRLDDKSHPMSGLAMFKMSFSQEVTEYVGAYDLVLNSHKYTLWKKYLERLYVALLSKVRKTTFY